jgi:SAM-dependent methyltransferase
MSDQWGFLAEHAEDWRAVLLFDTAARAGFLGESGTPAEIAERHALDPRAVQTVLEGLESFGLTSRGGERFDFVDVAAIAPTIRHHADVIRSWARLPERVVEPIAENRPRRSGEDLARWLEALAVGSRSSADWVVATCREAAPDAASSLDLGGGHGVYAMALARSGLESTIQDRPEVIDIVHPTMLDAGVQTFAGDFHGVLPDRTFDLVLLSGVAHTMAPERLQSLYRRLRPIVDQALVIMTTAGSSRRRSRMFAVQMLSAGNGGGTFTLEAHRRWLEDAGFSTIETAASDGEHPDVIVAR